MPLKDAARGLHGAGETFRGAFNAAVDKRLGESEEVVARQQAIAEQGRLETQNAGARSGRTTAAQNAKRRSSGEVGRGLPRVDEATAYI